MQTGRNITYNWYSRTKQTRFKNKHKSIKQGRFEDTNKLFQNPLKVDFHITEWNDHNHEDIAKEILKNV